MRKLFLKIVLLNDTFFIFFWKVPLTAKPLSPSQVKSKTLPPFPLFTPSVKLQSAGGEKGGTGWAF